MYIFNQYARRLSAATAPTIKHSTNMSNILTYDSYHLHTVSFHVRLLFFDTL